jgi:hypothetical protein
MIQKERIIKELNITSYETKNENDWNEQTIFCFQPYLHGIINFPISKLDENMLSFIKTVIGSFESLDKIARKHIKENLALNKKKNFWDISSKKINYNRIYLHYIIFYSDFTFRIKYRDVSNRQENIYPENYYFGSNFTKDLTIESLFYEIYPLHFYFNFQSYPIHDSKTFKDQFDKPLKIDRAIEEINTFSSEYPNYAYDNPTGDIIYEQYPQRKSGSITISLNKLHKDYKVHAKYMQKEPYNPANQDINWLCPIPVFKFKGAGVLRTNNIDPIKWLRQHNQETSGIISIPAKSKNDFYINCEIQNFKLKKMEIIEDSDACRKFWMDTNKIVPQDNLIFDTKFP